jgi:hypothetical protein
MRGGKGEGGKAKLAATENKQPESPLYDKGHPIFGVSVHGRSFL